MTVLKPATIIDQQIEILRERGMALDESLARQWLANVSYYRLSGYWYSYRYCPQMQIRKTLTVSIYLGLIPKMCVFFGRVGVV